MVKDGGRPVLPARGNGEEWIVKIATEEYAGLAENELTMLAWARAAGFDVPEAELVEPEALGKLRRFAARGSRVLAVRRYDREGTPGCHSRSGHVGHAPPDMAWSEVAAGTSMHASHVRALRDHWLGVPLLRDAGPLS